MVHLIDKDALVAEIYKLKKSHDNWSYMGKCFHQDYETLLSFIDTLDVKEVDLEKEIARYEESIYGFESSSRDDCIGIAKYFAEYGARMQKEQMMKEAVKGQIERGYGIDSEGYMDVTASLNPRDNKFEDFADKQIVKVIVLPSNNN